jgi:hypothetical protein
MDSERKLKMTCKTILLLMACLFLAMPALADKGGNGNSGNGNNGNGNGNGGGGGGEPPPGGGTLTVPCIEWAATGGRNQHIHVQAFVADQEGNPVLDAVVSMRAMKDGVEYNIVGGPTEDYSGLDGGVGCPDGPPGSGVTRDFCVNKADDGYYDVVVLSVSKDGYDWDGATPANGYDHIKP